MSGTGRRRHSKWDLKEDTSPENHDDRVRSNKDRSSFTGHVSRDHMSGTRDLQRAEGLNEKSIPGSDGDGHHATEKSTGLDGGRQKSRNHSPRSRGRSFRSRSRSKSRSRSPARNQSNRSGHSTPLCRDFAAGRCRKGDRCHFVHNGSSGRQLDERIGSDRESMHRDDEALKSHSDTRSMGRRSSNTCNDFLKGRCRRGASCKFSHHDPGSDEFGKGAVDGTENKPPDETQLKNHLNGIHEVSGDVKWGDKTLPRGMQNAHGQGAHQLNESFSASNPMDGVMQMPYHQAAFDDKPADDQSHMAFPSHHHPEGDDLQKLHHQSVVDSILDDGAYTGIADATSGPTPSEQLSQIPYLSATLAQLIEKREQLPQLYAANPQGTLMEGGSGLPNFSASVLTVSEAACDSIETKMASTSNELVTGETTVSDLLELCLSRDDELGHQSLDPNQQGAVDNENGGANEAKGQGPGEDVAAIDNANDDKKAKDVKDMRPFKFALAEFVKELLKPTWKEGKLSKEVHKTIVKKVVDKVTDSIQEAHIPRTKEKIDQYLSFSEPKLGKLVQAYLEKYKKP